MIFFIKVLRPGHTIHTPRINSHYMPHHGNMCAIDTVHINTTRGIPRTKKIINFVPKTINNNSEDIPVEMDVLLVTRNTFFKIY
jgi:hypothetical protein